MRKNFLLPAALMLSLLLTACTGTGEPSGSVNGGNAGSGNEVPSGDAGTVDTGNEDGGDETGEPVSGDAGSDVNTAEPASDVSWKEVYLDLLENKLDSIITLAEADTFEDWNFGFIYVNDDDIPELVASSGYEAAGSYVFTVSGNETDYFATNRLCLYYIPHGNYINNADGIMGYYQDTIYTIENGKFSLVASGNYSEIYGDNGYEGTEYYFDGSEVTKDEYFGKIDKLLPHAKRFYYDCGTKLEDMIRFLKGDGPKDYKEAYRELIENGILTETGDASYPAYALIEKKDSDPLLLMSSDNTFRIASFDDGLVNISHSWYFPTGDSELILLYPELGTIETLYFYVGSGYAFYTIEHGTLLLQSLSVVDKLDDEGNLIENDEGYPESVFTINGMEVVSGEVEKFLGVYDETFKEQVTAYSSDDVIIEYVSSDAMLDMLK